jgi:hypothetical protein
MTAQDIIKYVRDFIIEPIEGFWKDNEIFGYINEAINLLGASAHMEVKEDLPVDANGQATVPVDAIKVFKVEYNGDTIPYKKFDALIDVEDDNTTEVYYTRFGSTLYLHPVSGAVGTMTAYVLKRPARLAALTDAPNIPEVYHTMLGDYAIYKCKLKDGDITAADFLTQFSSKRQQMDEELSEQFRSTKQGRQVVDDWGEY